MKSILKKNEICYLSSMTRMMNFSQSQAPREAWWKFEENEGEDDDGNCDEDDDMMMMMMMMMMMIDDDDDDADGAISIIVIVINRNNQIIKDNHNYNICLPSMFICELGICLVFKQHHNHFTMALECCTMTSSPFCSTITTIHIRPKNNSYRHQALFTCSVFFTM